MKHAALHVGICIADELGERGWSTAECAARMSDNEKKQRIYQLTLDIAIAVAVDTETIRNCYIGREIAEALEQATGVLADNWMAIQNEWRSEHGLERIEQ